MSSNQQQSSWRRSTGGPLHAWASSPSLNSDSRPSQKPSSGQSYPSYASTVSSNPPPYKPNPRNSWLTPPASPQSSLSTPSASPSWESRESWNEHPTSASHAPPAWNTQSSHGYEHQMPFGSSTWSHPQQRTSHRHSMPAWSHPRESPAPPSAPPGFTRPAPPAYSTQSPSWLPGELGEELMARAAAYDTAPSGLTRTVHWGAPTQRESPPYRPPSMMNDRSITSISEEVVSLHDLDATLPGHLRRAKSHAVMVPEPVDPQDTAIPLFSGSRRSKTAHRHSMVASMPMAPPPRAAVSNWRDPPLEHHRPQVHRPMEEPMMARRVKSHMQLSSQYRESRESNVLGSLVEESGSVGIYVYGLPAWVKVPQLLSVFAEFGNIVNVSMNNKEDPCYAYVEYENTMEASRAHASLGNRWVFDMHEPLELLSQPKSSSRPSSFITPEYSEMDAALDDLKTLHIGNITESVTRRDLEKVFSTFGALKRVNIIQRPKDKRTFGFVTFKEADAAHKAFTIMKSCKQCYFNMTEPLKVDFSKIEQKKRLQDKKEEVGTSDVKKKSMHTKNRNILLVNIVPRGVEKEAMSTKFIEYGPVRALHLVQRVTPAIVTQTDTESPATSFSELDYFALVVFEQAEHAAQVAAAQVFDACFPRQRKLHVTHLPSSISLDQIEAYFSTMGEIKKVEKMPQDEKTVWGEDVVSVQIEFARAEGAVKALLGAIESPFAFSKDMAMSAEYTQSIRREEQQQQATLASSDEPSSDVVKQNTPLSDSVDDTLKESLEDLMPALTIDTSRVEQELDSPTTSLSTPVSE